MTRILLHLDSPAYRSHLVFMALLIFSGLANPAMGAEQAAPTQDSTRRCLRCHAMVTLGYRDPGTGEIISLFIDPQRLANSSHAQLACRDCHGRRYRHYPHPKQARDATLGCVGCHRDDEDDDRALGYRFDAIEAELAASVHATAADDPGAGPIGCDSCHDPHRFRVAQVGDSIQAIIRQHNQVCLSCHQELMAPGLGGHDWLPNPQAHWQSARCIDCHTEALGQASHRILPASEAARRCVGCHSRTAQLLSRLYDYRSEEELARRGWLAKAVLNEAYIVGMSRNPIIDYLSLLVLALVAMALSAHGLGRYLVKRRRGGSR